MSNKISQIEVLLKYHDIDILALSEHHATCDNLENLNLVGYVIVSHFSRRLHKNGGSVIFCKRSLNCKNLSKLKNLSIEGNIETSGIVLSTSSVKIAIINIYRPPSGDLKIFFDTLTDIITEVSKMCCYIILCGDLNIDLMKNTQETLVLRDILDSFNLKIKTNEPTRVFLYQNGHVSSTAIDYMSTNYPDDLTNCRIINPALSDHYGHLLELTCTTQSSAKTITKYSRRDFTDNGMNYFKYLVSQIQWALMNNMNVNEAFRFFIESVTWCLDISCPMKTITRTISQYDNVHKDRDWINDNIVSQGEYVKNLYWLLTNFPSNNIKEAYHREKQCYKKNIASTKKQYYANKIGKAHNKSKEIWTIVNKKIGKTKQENPKKICLNLNGTIIEDETVIANAFANFFSTAVSKQAEACFGQNLTLPCTTCVRNPESLFMYPSTVQDILCLIRNGKSKYSSGFDGLSLNVLAEIQDIIADHISFIFNKSIEEGCYPDIMKLAVVVPVLKKGDTEILDNYRQISLISTTAKLLERYVYNNIASFAEKHQLLTPSQHGFRTNKSVETATCHYLEYIYNHLDMGEYVVSLQFDLTKAFDSISKFHLENKLETLGIRGVTLKWCTSYIEQRKIQVKLGNAQSIISDISLGVPQGSVLGPMLFLLYINDLPLNISRGNITMFADDTTITVCGQTPEELQENVAIVMDEFSGWCQRNRLILNENKTVIINYTLQRQLPGDFAVLAGSTLSDTSKLLGTYFDSKLTFSDHIHYVCQQLNKAFYAVLQLKDVLDESAIISVYYALAYSRMSYNIMAWGNTKDRDRVFVAQKRLIRLIFNIKPGSTCRPIFKCKQILTFPCIYILKCVLFVKRNPVLFNTLGQFHQYNTRKGNHLSIKKHSTSRFKQSPNYNCTILFNNLPDCIKEIANYEHFKAKVKMYLADNVFYSISEFLQK
ncbi:unnamed protein product [Callosobruchus maculatus]|uniref:Reverse transcriptase domain-containing protein n=1 Tax=Callosobruchus maculatus TaxID=64391 RepID=A0A653CDQ4_CALMS|nr:unnamed protein product [Callosobruchus maculatus]